MMKRFWKNNTPCPQRYNDIPPHGRTLLPQEEFVVKSIFPTNNEKLNKLTSGGFHSGITTIIGDIQSNIKKFRVDGVITKTTPIVDGICLQLLSEEEIDVSYIFDFLNLNEKEKINFYVNALPYCSQKNLALIVYSQNNITPGLAFNSSLVLRVNEKTIGIEKIILENVLG